MNTGKKVKPNNYSNFYCLKHNKNAHFSIPFFAINDSFAKNRVYSSIISGVAPDLIFDTDVSLVRVFTFDNMSGEIVYSQSLKVCDIIDIDGVKEFIENVKKSNTVFENTQKGDL